MASRDIAEAFAALIRESRRPRVPSGVLQARFMSTDDLKKMWDAFDGDAINGAPGDFWPPDRPHIEDVHQVLNERGEGYYCPV